MATAPSEQKPDRVDAAAVARGVRRLFWHQGTMLQPEVPLRNGRRADLMGLTAQGEIVLVEIKCARADLLGDRKWPDYLDYCDRFYWAICPEIDPALLEADAYLPARCGLIVADGYEATMARPAAAVPLAAARRKVEVHRLAHMAMRRLTRIADPLLDDGTHFAD